MEVVLSTPFSVLVVDDDPLFQKVISHKLKTNGYSVINALDGAAAIAAMREQQPDAVLLDVNFPPDIPNGVSVPCGVHAALRASVVDVQRFPSGRHFPSWIGLTARETSSAGRRRVGRIS